MLKLIFLFVFILNFSVVFSDIISTDSNGNLIYDDEEIILKTELLNYYDVEQVDSKINVLENETQSLWGEVSNFFTYDDLITYFYEKDEIYTKNETDNKIGIVEGRTQNLEDEILTFFNYDDLITYFYEKDEIYTKNETDTKINVLNQNLEDSTNELTNTTQNLQSQIDVIDGNTFSGDYDELTNKPDLSVYTLISDFNELENDLENNYYDISQVDSQITALDIEVSDLRTLTQEDYYTSEEVDDKISNLESSITTDTNETPRVDELYDIVDSLNNFSGDYDDLNDAPNLEVYDDALLDLEENYYTDDEVDNQINTLSDVTQDLQNQINDIDLQSVNETSQINELDIKFTNELNSIESYDDTSITNQINEVNTTLSNDLTILENEINSLNNFSGEYNDLTNQPDLSVYNQSSDINSLNLTIQESVFSENINKVHRGSDTLTMTNQVGSLKIQIDFEKTFDSTPLLFLSFKEPKTTNNTFSYSINSISQSSATIILSENFDNVFENDIIIDWIIIE